jgi:hypothetical protein
VYRVTAGDPLQEPSRQATEQQDESALEQGDAPPHLSSASRLFFWLAGRPGFRSRISYSDADYFNLSAKDTAVAKADHAMSTSVRERLSRMRAMSVPRAKTITTYFYPVGDDFRTVVEEWIIFLQPYLDSR